ncbi:MAG: Gx transporter family protein [Eggerthellaceae bacterium]|nr:Gx transporter family protein [Eggerthellaceae bacterium]
MTPPPATASVLDDAPSRPAEARVASTLSAAEARCWARTGVLAAFALLLSYAETFVPLPLPVPGAKLGLANAAVLLALETVGWRGALAVALIKTLVTGILFGSPIMLPYSAAGTALSFAGMALLTRVPGLSVVLTSVFGAVLHVMGQLVVASLMLGTSLVWFSLPLLAAIALVTGALTGLIVRSLLKALTGTADPPAPAAPTPAAPAVAPAAPVPAAPARTPDAPLAFAWPAPRRAAPPLARVGARPLLAGLALYTLAVFLVDGPAALAACLVIAAAAAIAARLTPRDVARALVPLASVAAITALAHIAYAQQGAVVLELGPLVVTEGALRATAVLVLRLLCLMTAGAAAMAAIDGNRLLTTLRDRLQRAGAHRRQAEALGLAVDVAAGFVPVLTGQFDELRAQRRRQDPSFGTGGPLRRLRDYRQLLAPLAVGAFAHADAVAALIAGDRPEGSRLP